MIKRLFTTAAVMFLVAATTGAARVDPFKGVWKIEVVPDAAGKGFSDTLKFGAGGGVEATGLKAKGWTTSDYDDDTRGITTAKFSVTMKHPKDGEMKWEGSVTGASMRGTIVWKKKTGDENYTFTGEKNGG